MAKGDYMGADISRAEADLLKPAIAELLRTIPESWAEFDLDRLTVIQDNALFLLTAAGMVERRGWLRSTIANHPTAFEVRFQATGEGGFAKAMEQAVAAEYETWKETWRKWKVGETKDVSPFRTEAMKPQEWRLTDQGVVRAATLATRIAVRIPTRHSTSFSNVASMGRVTGVGWLNRLPKRLTGRLSRNNPGMLVKIGPICRGRRCPDPAFSSRSGRSKSPPPPKPSN